MFSTQVICIVDDTFNAPYRECVTWAPRVSRICYLLVVVVL